MRACVCVCVCLLVLLLFLLSSVFCVLFFVLFSLFFWGGGGFCFLFCGRTLNSNVSCNLFGNEIKLNAISTVSILRAELSLFTSMKRNNLLFIRA